MTAVKQRASTKLPLQLFQTDALHCFACQDENMWNFHGDFLHLCLSAHAWLRYTTTDLAQWSVVPVLARAADTNAEFK